MRNAKLFIVLVAILAATTVYAVPFDPPVVTISTTYTDEWDGGNAVVTFDLVGRACTVYLAVYTRGMAADIPYTNTNSLVSGLPYHYVNGIDTLVYLSTGEAFAAGTDRSITWDGMDKIGAAAPNDSYDYYLIAIDEGVDGAPIPTGLGALGSGWNMNSIQYEASSVGVLVKPRIWQAFSYQEVGNDTESAAPVVYTPPDGAASVTLNVSIDPDDDAIIYFENWDAAQEMAGQGKAEINPDGPATLDMSYATDGWFYYDQMGDRYTSCGSALMDGVVATSSMNYMEDFANIYTLNSADGSELLEIDLSEWFVDPSIDGQKCGGPGRLRFSANKPNAVFNVISATCARLCFDSSKEEPTIFWANMNGDYYCDKNYPGCVGYNAEIEWRCQDYMPGVYNYSTHADDFDFTHIINNWAGTGKWQILGPDGSGIATAISLGHIEGNNRHYMALLDGGSAYDGVYSRTTTTESAYEGWQGYDVAKGYITVEVGVEDETPVAYDLSNAPDPFNPATTISYSMGKAGNVNLEVFNVLGQKVASLFDGQREAGSYSVRWDASDFANGVYFAVMKTEGFTKTEKMMLVK